jgi:hypothetical protein
MTLRAFACCSLLGIAIASAQPRPGGEVPNNVTARGDVLSVTVSGARLSTLQPLERQLVLQAQELFLQHLCGRALEPGEQMNGSLKGMNVVHRNEQQGTLSVTVQIRRQDSGCEVRRIASPASSAPGQTAGAAAPAPPSAVPVVPGSPITVREHKGEM